MSFFKGDIVVCVDDERCGKHGITKGHYYEVIYSNHPYNVRVVCDDRCEDDFFSHRFKIAPEHEFKHILEQIKKEIYEA